MIGITYGYYVKNGGIGRYISEYSKNLNNLSKINILTLENGMKQNVPSVRVITCERDNTFMSGTENANFSKEVNKISKEYSAIHLHGLYDITPELYTAHICLKKYIDRHKEVFGDREFYNNLDFTPMLELEEKLFSQISPNQLIVVSDKLATDISEIYGYNKNKIKVIKGASRFNARIPNETKSNHKISYNIGFIGGNLYSKGIVFMKDVFNNLESKGIHIHCIGAGCDNTIKKYMTENVHFTSQILGKIDIEKEFYESLDLFLCLSISDSYSLSGLEAMSLNVPIISSNNNGLFKDHNDMQLARVKDVTNTTEVSLLIEKVLTDNQFKSEILVSGYKIANELSWIGIASKYDKIYEKYL